MLDIMCGIMGIFVTVTRLKKEICSTQYHAGGAILLPYFASSTNCFSALSLRNIVYFQSCPFGLLKVALEVQKKVNSYLTEVQCWCHRGTYDFIIHVNMRFLF